MPASPTPAFIDHVVQLYGDLLFDLCASILASPAQAQTALRSILKEVQGSKEPYKENERAWILRLAFDRLKTLSVHQGRKFSASEQAELDANPNSAARLKNFDLYLHRLLADEQMILLLRDKYGLPYGEIASATGIPEASLKTIRQQALRALETWIWPE